ncbi:MAG: Os1348 family NHLP clan protein [Pseudomonadota bacterium]
MSQEAVERVLGRLITDERFRRAVGDCLEAACVQQGYSLSRTELRLLSELELKRIDALAARINPGLCRADTPFS